LGAIKDASLQERITVSPNPVITTAMIDLGNNYREISLEPRIKNQEPGTNIACL